MSINTEIIYCNVLSDDALTEGHWFFHTGQNSQCAQAHKNEHLWTLIIDFERYNKPINNDLSFKSIEECKIFVSEYFETPVKEVSVEKFESYLARDL